MVNIFFEHTCLCGKKKERQPDLSTLDSCLPYYIPGIIRLFSSQRIFETRIKLSFKVVRIEDQNGHPLFILLHSGKETHIPIRSSTNINLYA